MRKNNFYLFYFFFLNFNSINAEEHIEPVTISSQGKIDTIELSTPTKIFGAGVGAVIVIYPFVKEKIKKPKFLNPNPSNPSPSPNPSNPSPTSPSPNPVPPNNPPVNPPNNPPNKTNYTSAKDEEIFTSNDKIRNVLYKYNGGGFDTIGVENIGTSNAIIIEIKEYTSKILETFLRIQKYKNIRKIYVVLDEKFVNENLKENKMNEMLKYIRSCLDNKILYLNTTLIVYSENYEKIMETESAKTDFGTTKVKKIDELNLKFQKFLQGLNNKNPFVSRIG
jgi:hypothetical protein